MYSVDESAPNINPVKKHKKLLPIILVSAILLTAGVLFVSIFFNNLGFGKIEKNVSVKSKLNSALDNPIVMKAAESLPIPKITLVPVTPRQVSPTQIQADGEINSEIGAPEANSSDEFGSVFDKDRVTYANNDLNYSIDYPADYKVEENSYGLGVSQVNFISPNNNEPGKYPDIQLLVYPAQIGKLIGQDFEKLYSLEENSTQKMSSETIDPRLFTVIAKKQIAGNRAFEFRTTDDPPDDNIEAETGVYIYANDMIFIFSTGESGKNLLDRMALTFKMN